MPVMYMKRYSELPSRRSELTGVKRVCSASHLTHTSGTLGSNLFNKVRVIKVQRRTFILSEESVFPFWY